jgi:Protein of unknown function (DUF2637)
VHRLTLARSTRAALLDDLPNAVAAVVTWSRVVEGLTKFLHKVARTPAYAKEMIAEVAAGDATTRGAVRFFWIWLTLATSVSVAGNVAHAVLTAPSGTVRLAAAAAVVPPAVLLGSTHSVALLVRTRRVGFNYWCALAMTIALAGCAFLLSFDALRDLAVVLGMLPDRAWLWPVAIDVSIANSTLSLLSLSPPRATPGRAKRCDGTVRQLPAKGTPRRAARARTSAADSVAPPTRNRGPVPPAAGRPPGDAPQQRGALVPASSQPSDRTLAAVPEAATQPGGAAAHQQWAPVADQLVRSGVTSKDPAIEAAVLADHAAGTPRSTIGRRHNVHHSTVGRILAGAEGLTGWSTSSL